MRTSGTVISDLKAAMIESSHLEKLANAAIVAAGDDPELSSLKIYIDNLYNFRQATIELLLSRIDPSKITSDKGFKEAKALHCFQMKKILLVAIQ